ncbi:MAG TPA: hypothetical protein VFG19_00950 [Geobacteraceae bacterium]|nr:hypothetical protein [Geobacteraceae bacterium]
MKYDSYVNARFDYEISYPAGILVPQGEADNGDGQKFISGDGKTIMLAYGYNNSLDYTLKSLFHDETGKNPANPKRKITYKLMKKNHFVLSGIDGSTIFYEKVVYKEDDDQFVHFEITYPKAQKQFYDPIVTEISKSIKILPSSYGGK